MTGRNTAVKRLENVIIIDQHFNAHHLNNSSAKRGNYQNLVQKVSDENYKAEQPLLSSHSAVDVGEKFEANTRSIDASDSTHSNGKLLRND